MKKFLIILTAAVMLLFTACAAPTATDEQNSSPPEIINNTPEEFEALMPGEYLLLDVRSLEEYQQGHIYDPKLIPLDELEGRLAEIEEYKTLPVLVYCRSGNRSVAAADILLANGFTKVHNLLGGIGAWNNYKGN